MILCSEKLPTDSKAYLVQFHYTHYNDNAKDWFEVVHFQAKCQKWKRLNNCAYAWMELPEPIN